jgi:hypothetical protein
MLYQLSYASPKTASMPSKTASPSGYLPRKPVIRADTLLLPAYHGTVSKVSISMQVEQPPSTTAIPLLFRQFGLTLDEARVNLAFTA